MDKIRNRKRRPEQKDPAELEKEQLIERAWQFERRIEVSAQSLICCINKGDVLKSNDKFIQEAENQLDAMLTSAQEFIDASREKSVRLLENAESLVPEGNELFRALYRRIGIDLKEEDELV